MTKPHRLFYPVVAVLATLLAACSSPGSQTTQGALETPQVPQTHVMKLINSGVSIHLKNANTGSGFSTQFWTEDNCGEFPFTPNDGGINAGQTINLTQTGSDCFVPPSFTSIGIGPTRVEQDCTFSITGSSTGVGDGFTFSVVQGSEATCSVSPSYGTSSTFSWAYKT